MAFNLSSVDLQALERSQADNAERELIYREVQKPYLDDNLSKKIGALMAELKHLQFPEWKQASFENTVLLLSRIEVNYHRLHNVGECELFKQAFVIAMRPYIDALFAKMPESRLKAIVATPIKVKIGDSRLEELFQNCTAETASQPVVLVQKASALAFLKLMRQETLA